jgi:hypothetical protein
MGRMSRSPEGASVSIRFDVPRWFRGISGSRLIRPNVPPSAKRRHIDELRGGRSLPDPLERHVILHQFFFFFYIS